VAPGELVEGREQLVQDLHHLLGAALLAAPGEVDQVGEQHRDLGEAVGDQILVLLEPGGDGGGQHIQQQPLGPLFLSLQRAAGPHRLPQQQHGREQHDIPGDIAQHLERRLVWRQGLVADPASGGHEPANDQQRPQAVTGHPGGGQGHRQWHRRIDARVVELVVDLQNDRRGQQHRQGPSPPGQHQGGDRPPQHIGGRLVSRARLGRHANGDRDRHPQPRCQARVDHRGGDPLQPLHHRAHAGIASKHGLGDGRRAPAPPRWNTVRIHGRPRCGATSGRGVLHQPSR
jgi:hypothetical protein